MLHLSSLHYCACYYALLCLLHQQQQALAVTIIIDGATTNEWATQDEYQGLLEGARAAASGSNGGAGSRASGRGGGGGGGGNGAPGNGGETALNGAEERQQAEQIMRSLSSSAAVAAKHQQNQRQHYNHQQQHHQQHHQQPAGGSAVAGRLVVGAPVESDDPSATQDVLAAPNSMDELGLALDRLERIEHDRKEQVRELNRLKALEKAAEGSVVSALAHRTGKPPPAASGGAARTISDLVAPTDDDDDDDDGGHIGAGPGQFGEPGKHLVERETRKRYCGDVLMDLLDMVCKSRFYAGDSDPQVVQPTISKRSIDYAEALAGEPSGSSRRRKLRTDGDGERAPQQQLGATSSLSNNENRFNDGMINNNKYLNQQQQYLSNTSSGNNNNNNPSAKGRRANWAARYRRVRGATNQCCTNPCLVEELKPYCEGPKKA